MTATTTTESALASSYNDVLCSSADLARATHQELVQAHRDHGLMIHDRPLCNVLRPRFMTRRRRDELARISKTLADLFERIGERLLSADSVLDLAWASEQEREIWAVEAGYRRFSVTSRLDSFMVGELPQFVEYNAESPASIGFSDVLTAIFRSLPVMRGWNQEIGRLSGFEARQALLDTLLDTYREWGGSGTASIAIIDWDGVLTRRDFELCGEYFTEHGIPVVITDPRNLRYRNGRLWAGDQEINLVYRRVLLHELLEKADEADDLLRAYREGAVCMVNSPRSKLLHKKSVLALLSEGTLDIHITPEEQHVVDATIPWTRRLVEGETSYKGEMVNVIDQVLAQQNQLVLKPSDDYGGRGVVLGWETEPRAWEQAIDEALGQPYIVQERVPVPQADFPVWTNERAEVCSLLVDSDPLLFNGEMGGILSRISGSALLNVTAGAGSQAPTLIVDEDA